MSDYDADYSVLGSWERTWERKMEDGTYRKCNSWDPGAKEVKTCTYCGNRIYGSRCDCTGSRW